MPNELFNHYRIIESALRYDLEIDDAVDTETAIRWNLDQLKYEANIIAGNIGFIERYLRDSYPSPATDTDDDDDVLSEYDPTADHNDSDAGVTAVIPFEPPTSA